MTNVLGVHAAEQAVLDVVFVHGPDARETWTTRLAEEYPEVAIWTVDHGASSNGWSDVVPRLRGHGIGTRPLCFVTDGGNGSPVTDILAAFTSATVCPALDDDDGRIADVTSVPDVRLAVRPRTACGGRRVNGRPRGSGEGARSW